MREAARAAGRDPDAIKLSLVGYPIVGEDRAEYRELLEERAAARDRDPDEFEAFLVERGMLHGTTDEVQSQLASFAEAGVARYYVQVYAPLDDVDTDDVTRVLNVLEG